RRWSGWSLVGLLVVGCGVVVGGLFGCLLGAVAGGGGAAGGAVDAPAGCGGEWVVRVGGGDGHRCLPGVGAASASVSVRSSPRWSFSFCSSARMRSRARCRSPHTLSSSYRSKVLPSSSTAVSAHSSPSVTPGLGPHPEQWPHSSGSSPLVARSTAVSGSGADTVIRVSAVLVRVMVYSGIGCLLWG